MSSPIASLHRLSFALLLLLVAGALTGCVRRAVVMPTDQAGEDPPAGMVDVNVVSDDSRQTWTVSASEAGACSTPCKQRVTPWQSLFLEARDGDQLFVPGVGDEAQGAQRVLLVAEGTREGEQINGIVFTTLGGMGVVTAIALTAIGCSNLEKRAGTCTAGLITGAVTVPLTAVAIWMIVDSLPRAHILPVFKAPVAAGQTPVTFLLTPTGVVGTF